jgi:hypothetical protein
MRFDEIAWLCPLLRFEHFLPDFGALAELKKSASLQ